MIVILYFIVYLSFIIVGRLLIRERRVYEDIDTSFHIRKYEIQKS